MKQRRDFLQVTRDCHRPRDHVEQDVPLRAKEHQQDRTNADARADMDQRQQDDREENRRRERSGNLRQGLRDARQAGMKTNGHTRWNGPQGGYDEREVHAQERCSCAFQ